MDISTYLATHDGWLRVRKRPLTVLAMRLDEEVAIETKEGTMLGRKGDYLVRGTAGEYYPVKPEIFHQLYEGA